MLALFGIGTARMLQGGLDQLGALILAICTLLAIFVPLWTLLSHFGRSSRQMMPAVISGAVHARQAG